MSNPLFTMLGSQMPPELQIIQEFNKFKSEFKGNAQSQVQQLMNSGRISQSQYNDAVRKAQALQSLLHK